MTSFSFRLLCVVPEARRVALNTWIKANIDPGGGDWVVPRLSATGSAPYTHGWFSAALTAAQFKLMMQRLCSTASVTPPANWDAMTRAEKKAWLVSQRASINTNAGIYLQASDNDGVWDNSVAAKAAKGLA